MVEERFSRCRRRGAAREQAPTPDNIAQARSFFDHALSTDPSDVDALVESARSDVFAGVLFGPISCRP
jgi:hypothetical protein